MRLAFLAVHVKFFFKKRVYGAVEVKRKAGRAGHAKFVVQVKAAPAFAKKGYFAARKAPTRAAIIPVGFAVGLIVLRHLAILPPTPFFVLFLHFFS